jgi:hypothetical protein
MSTLSIPHRLKHLVAVALLAGMSSGCTRVIVHMSQNGSEVGPDYVVVKLKANKDVVYDCRSAPEGEHDPVCVRTAFRLNSVAAEARADRRAERMEKKDD